MSRVVFIACFALTALAGRAQLAIPCMPDNDSYTAGEVETVTAYNCLYAPGVAGTVEVSDASEITYKAGEEIILQPGFSASAFTGNGEFNALIEEEEVDVVLIEPGALNANGDIEVQCYEKLEFGLRLPDYIEDEVDLFLLHGGGLNPFMSGDVLIEASFTFPNGAVRKVFGFFYEDYTRDLVNNEWVAQDEYYRWRIRAGFGYQTAPEEYIQCDISVRYRDQFGVLHTLNVKSINYKYICTGNPGYVTRGYDGTNDDRYLRYSGTGETFFPRGTALLWNADEWPEELEAEEYTLAEDWMNHISDNGGNTMRLVMAPWSYSIEWENLGRYRLTNCWEIDQIVERAEDIDMKLIMMLGIHDETIDKPGGHLREGWDNNPYHTQLGLVDNLEWFTSPLAEQYQKERYRYIISRWGYSTSIMAWELLSELDVATNTETDNTFEVSEVIATNHWFGVMYDYIKYGLDHSQHLISCSYSQNIDENHLNDYTFNHGDMTLLHWYGDDGSETNWDRYEAIRKALNDLNEQPVMFDEIGIQPPIDLPCTGADIREAMWATALMGSCGAGMNWFIHDFDDNGYYEFFQPISAFFDGEDLAQSKYDQHRWMDALFIIENARITSYNITNLSKTKSLGFVENALYNWQTDPAISACGLTPDNPAEMSNEEFKVEGLKTSFLFIQHHYRIEFYNTVGTGGYEPAYDQTVTSNFEGRATFEMPPTDAEHPDWAYKIYYTGLNAGAVEPNDKSRSDTLTEKNILKHDDVELATTFTLVPNPTTGIFNVMVSPKMHESGYSIEVRNLIGELILTQSVQPSSFVQLDLSEHPAGVYLVSVRNGDSINTRKLVVN